MNVETLSRPVSESLRATAGTESRYRIQRPNSRRRRFSVIALGRSSGEAIEEVMRGFTPAGLAGPAEGKGSPADEDGYVAHSSTAFFVALNGDGLASFSGTRVDVDEVVGATDSVILVLATGDENQSRADPIVQSCRKACKSVLTVLLTRGDHEDDALRSALGHLRPQMQMLVVTSEADYVATLLTALGG